MTEYRLRGWKLRSANEMHVKNALNDPELNNAIDKLPTYNESSSNKYEELAKSFAVSVELLRDVKKGGREMAMFYSLEFLQGRWSFYDKENEVIVFEMKPNITKEEYVEYWNIIRRIRDKESTYVPRKKKAPIYDELVYAVFRARQNGKTYSAIFKMYKEGNLGSYKKQNKIFLTSDELKEYYLRNKPN